ncbi:MAG: type II toxin-antitoxin system VapC family toxin [Acidobacteriota bacterium]|jgi:predicted nucleic acid-binding protein
MPADATSVLLSGPVVIDASAVVEYLVELTLTEPATRLFHLAAEGRVELWAPDLVYPESASALRKLVRLDAIAAEPARIAVENLVDLPIAVAGTAALMSEVWRMQAFMTPYDACYVALADALGAELVTAERNLAMELRKRKKRARFLGAL